MAAPMKQNDRSNAVRSGHATSMFLQRQRGQMSPQELQAVTVADWKVVSLQNVSKGPADV